MTPQVGAGPFSLILSEELSFPQHISPHITPHISKNKIMIGTLIINLTKVTLWSPRPDWRSISAETVLKHHPFLTSTLTQHPHLTVQLTDFTHITAVAHHLAGRGTGLTPSGDDFLLGLIFALWVFLPTNQAQTLAHHITTTAISRTTTFSAAWLHAAARGEAHLSWHNLVSALSNDDPPAIQTAVHHILHFGHTSGADALSGFLTTAGALLTKHPAAPFWQIDN